MAKRWVTKKCRNMLVPCIVSYRFFVGFLVNKLFMTWGFSFSFKTPENEETLLRKRCVKGVLLRGKIFSATTECCAKS